MYNVWCVDLPGIQSIFIPKPGINQECITSKLFVITLIKIPVGNIKILLTDNKRLLLEFKKLKNVSKSKKLS
jgi:hypothetical protein